MNSRTRETPNHYRLVEIRKTKVHYLIVKLKRVEDLHPRQNYRYQALVIDLEAPEE